MASATHQVDENVSSVSSTDNEAEETILMPTLLPFIRVHVLSYNEQQCLPVLARGYARFISDRQTNDIIGVLGMSLGNSFFNQTMVSALLSFLMKNCTRLYIFIPDIPAQYTYQAIGDENYKRRIRLDMNRYRRWIQYVMDTVLQVDQRVRVVLVDWERDVTSNAHYQHRLAAYQKDYQEQKCPLFVRDIQDQTRQVLLYLQRFLQQRSTMFSVEKMDSAVNVGATFLLMELAFLTTFHHLFPDVIHSSSELVYVYHRRWPVFERLLSNQYALTHPHDTDIGFIIIEATYDNSINTKTTSVIVETSDIVLDEKSSSGSENDQM